MLLIKDVKYLQSEFHSQSVKMWEKHRKPPMPSVLNVAAIEAGGNEPPPDSSSSSTSSSSAASLVSSHVALAPVLIVAQIFAVMPLYGIRTPEAEQLRFVWMSGRMLHSVLVMSAVTVLSVMSIIWIATGQTTIDRLQPTVWFLSKSIIMINFTLVARRWPRLMTFWQSVESRIPLYADAARNLLCHRQIKWYTMSITCIIFVEHSMSIAAGVYRGTQCVNTTTVQGYFGVAFPQLYQQLDWMHDAIGQEPTVDTIDILTLIAVEYTNYYCMFLWTFMDIFIVTISLCLTQRLSQLNEHMERHRGLAMSENFWREQRTCYASLAKLIEMVDDTISVVTTMSVSNNLYYILIQLLNSFHPKETPMHIVYFWSSLVFLIFRMLSVTLHAARVNDEAKRPVEVLRAIPTKYFYPEAQRFLDDVMNANITLTGMRFFSMNRTLILSMAGTIVTYELVLIQFQAINVNVKKISC